MADDGLSNLSWLTAQQGRPALPNPPTPPSTPPHKTTTHKREELVDYKHVATKPRMSYAQLITLAMEAFGGDKVLLTDIYDWVKENFAYFRQADTSWQNSIRHNLSLNKQFVKVTRTPLDKGKGSYWMLDQSKKDPYCMRRRNFPPDSRPTKPKPSATRPCVNPAMKSYLEQAHKHSATPPTSFVASSSLDPSEFACVTGDVGAQECVVADSFNGPLLHTTAMGGDSSFDSSYQPQIAGEKVRVEYNWDDFEYHSSSWTGGAQLPLQCGPFSPTTQAALGSVGLSPPNSEEVDHTGGHYELRIPTPEWWRSSNVMSTQLSPGTGSIPLARVFESLNSSGCSSVSVHGSGHPWQEALAIESDSGVLQELTDYTKM